MTAPTSSTVSTVDTASSRADGDPQAETPFAPASLVTIRSAAAPSPLRYPPPLEKVTG
ncbi:hypothetical protein UA74_20570 [Actinoalloteichus fjordicus]|uniref:Uncharacterized protein n=1 Tax=Actinoalloteichus fjordicus TaxID=1612552 RepID=A0AAC9LGZ4_9PSEU|nr:hypothetical protein UA74_20570 [Actinoalloteichus fjordicus]